MGFYWKSSLSVPCSSVGGCLEGVRKVVSSSSVSAQSVSQGVGGVVWVWFVIPMQSRPACVSMVR